MQRKKWIGGNNTMKNVFGRPVNRPNDVRGEKIKAWLTDNILLV